MRLVPLEKIDHGPPSSEDHQKGEFFVDANGGLFYCFAESEPDTVGVDGNPVTPSWRELVLRPKNTLGPPKEGKHTSGEFYADMQKSLWFCVEDGIPGRWKEVRLEKRFPVLETIFKWLDTLSNSIPLPRNRLSP